MTSWVERGRPSLFAAISNVCDQITQDLEGDFEERDARIAQEYDKRTKAEATVTSLRAEIARLKSELESANAPRATTAPPPQHRLASAGEIAPSVSSAHTPSSSPGEKDWKVEYQKGKAKLQLLGQNFKKAKEHLEKRKDERKRWVDHVEWLEEKITAAEEKHGIHILDKADRITRSEQPKEERSERPSPAVSLGSFGEQDTAEGGTRSSNPVPIEANSGLPANDRLSESTDDAPNDQAEVGDQLPNLPPNNAVQEVTVKQEPSSDGPVILFKRPVKRRRHNGDTHDVPVARRIKTEPDQDSSPLMPINRCDFSPHESIDLGADARHMETPRKRKEPEQHLPTVSEERDWVSHDQVNETYNIEASPTPTLPVPQSRCARASSALTPVDSNLRIIKPEMPRPPATKNLNEAVSRGIESLAEDGTAYRKNLYTKAPITPTVKGRLNSLLNTPTTEETTSVSRSSRRPRESPAHPHGELPLPKARDLPFDRSTRESLRDTPRNSTAARSPMVDETNTTSKAVAHPTISKKPRSLLRNKPVSELQLDDFKINPNANEGHSFAFSEVVRDKDGRACLPGCVDMHCCGKEFRALALSQKPNPPLTAAQKQEEEKLLVDYMGTDSHRLQSISREDRDKLWLEAKTQELANRYGKHRQRFSRMRSPPGFWNADFPDTQELQEERAEARKRARKTVQERHREAMRPGGRWMFRDE